MRTSRMKLQHLILTAIVLWRLCGAGAAAQSLQPDYIDDFAGNPRVVVLSDIGNEPDDQMSFVRLLLYSNELDLEALIAATSTWQKNKVQPETMHEIVAAYGKVRANLLTCSGLAGSRAIGCGRDFWPTCIWHGGCRSRKDVARSRGHYSRYGQD